MHELLVPSEAVRTALAEGRPVVALESTIVAHGMPYPANLETAERLMAAVTAEGAVPALIALDAGRIVVGTEPALLERLAAGKEPVAKVSRADLPAVLASGGLGATTVAATMIGAHLAGIAVFATGGIGGVHRGVERTLDISADLDELARTPVTVVCAGAKAILDLPRTLEYLETRGVPVVGYRTDELPGFWSRSSGLPIPIRRDDPAGIAAIVRTQRQLGFATGLLVANPPPPETALPRDLIERAIEAALPEAERQGITGKAVTPFLLAEIAARTGGRSLATNIALVLANATLAARIARALAEPTPEGA